VGSDRIQKMFQQYQANQQMQLSRPERDLVASAQVEQQKVEQGPVAGFIRGALRNAVTGPLGPLANDLTGGVVNAMVDSAGHTASLGFDETALAAADSLGSKTFGQAKEAQVKQRQQREQEHPLASAGGGMAGYVAAPFGKAKTVVGAMAGSAAQAGLTSLNETGSVGEAAKSAAGGALAGGAGAALGKGVAAVANRKQAAKQAVGALSGTQADREAIDVGLKKVGGREALGSYLLDKKIVTAKDSVFTIKQKVEKELQAIGEQIGQQAAQFDEMGFGLDPKLVMGKIRATVGKLTTNNAAAEKIRTAIAPSLRTFEEQYVKRMMTNPNAPLKLSELHAFQASLKNAFDMADGAARDALTTLEKTLSDELMTGIESAAKFYSKGKVPTQYLDLKRQYQMLALAKRAAESGASKAEKFAQNDMVKSAKFVGGMMGFASGGPVGALKGAAAGALVPVAQQRARSVVASALNQAAKTPQAVSQMAGQAPQAGILEVLRQMGGQ
jgi:hypothetical protein